MIRLHPRLDRVRHRPVDGLAARGAGDAGPVRGAGMIVGRTIVRDVFEGEAAQRTMSHMSMIFGVAPVLRPVLRCVTCRTLTSVLAWLRSISLCRFLTRGQSCSCDALKIRCLSRLTWPSCSRQLMLSHQVVGAVGAWGWSSGPFTSSRPAIATANACPVIGVQLVLRLRWFVPLVFISSPAHVSALPRPGTSPVSGQLCAAPEEGPEVVRRVPAAFRLPPSLLGDPVPPRASAPLTIGLPRCGQRGP